MNMYANYLKELEESSGKNIEKLELLDRVTTILKEVSKERILKENIALKGDSAINIGIFNFIKIQNKVEFVTTNVNTKEILEKMKHIIENNLIKYLKQNGYCIEKKEENGTIHITAEYTNQKGNKELIQLEFELTLKKSLIEPINMELTNTVFPYKKINLYSLSPREVFVDEICKLIKKPHMNTLYNIYQLNFYGLFGEFEKPILNKCFILKYITDYKGKLEELTLDNIQNIRTSNEEEEKVKNETVNYLTDMIVIDEAIMEFYKKYKEKKYQPEILFDDEKMLSRAKMIKV